MTEPKFDPIIRALEKFGFKIERALQEPPPETLTLGFVDAFTDQTDRVDTMPTQYADFFPDFEVKDDPFHKRFVIGFETEAAAASFLVNQFLTFIVVRKRLGDDTFFVRAPFEIAMHKSFDSQIDMWRPHFRGRSFKAVVK